MAVGHIHVRNKLLDSVQGRVGELLVLPGTLVWSVACGEAGMTCRALATGCCQLLIRCTVSILLSAVYF